MSRSHDGEVRPLGARVLLRVGGVLGRGGAQYGVVADLESRIDALKQQGVVLPDFWIAGKAVMSDNSGLLQESLAALTRYFVGSSTLAETLHRVAELTIRAVPQTDHVGITMMVNGRPGTAIFTHPEVPEIDQAQYRTGDGPCLDAFHNGVPHIIISTLERGRWQEFRDSAARHGVLSTMSMPMIASDGPIGALNMYAEHVDAYSDDDIDAASGFVSQAAFVLANAQAYWDARNLNENLEKAMDSRATIEQAKGIIMNTLGCDPDEAFKVLVQQSQAENIKLRDLATQIVNNASRKH